MKIPMFSTKCAEKSEPLKRIVKQTALRSGCSEMTVAFIMSHFLEQMAFEIASGKEVIIPGFGAFAAVNYNPKKPGLLSYPTPRFYPSRGFRNEVSLTCPKSNRREADFEKYRKRHSLWNDKKKKHAMVFSAMESFRQQVKAQAPSWECGVDP